MGDRRAAGLACMIMLGGCSDETRKPSVVAKTVQEPVTSGGVPPTIAPGKRTASSSPAGAGSAAAANEVEVAPVPATPPAAPTPAIAKALLADKDPKDVERLFPARKRPREQLPDLLQRRIRNKLRDVSKAPIALRDAIYLPREDGSAEVLAIYELSAYEDCVLRHGGSRKAARAQCLPELQEVSGVYSSFKVRLNAKCRSYGVAHASLGATAEGAKLQVTHYALAEDVCKVVSLRQFFLDDVDRDGEPELVLEATGEREEIFEDGRAHNYAVGENGTNYLWVLKIGEEMTEQIHFSMADYRSDESWWVDLNHDERPDLVQIADCKREGYDPERDPCDETLLTRIWHVYDREQDRWLDDEAANRAEAEAAEPPRGAR
jgi:hypothetical protein